MYRMNNVVNEVKDTGAELLEATYTTTLSSVDTAFALAAALAWTEAIKVVVMKAMPKGSSGNMQMLYYALLVTVMYTVYMMVSNRKSKKLDISKLA